MADKTWIEEQKANRLFRGGGRGGDAQKMLEHSPTNKYVSQGQGRKTTSARYIGEAMGIFSIGHLCDMIEQTQLCVDGRSRDNFMKVAIEQWQGKLSHNRKITLENLV